MDTGLSLSPLLHTRTLPTRPECQIFFIDLPLVLVTQIMARVKYIQIRATCADRMESCSLISPSLQTGEAAVQLEEIDRLPLEKCECPLGYAGLSCEVCAVEYVRIEDDRCVRRAACRCNGHSDDCDPLTGVCVNCLHNTQGK